MAAIANSVQLGNYGNAADDLIDPSTKIGIDPIQLANALNSLIVAGTLPRTLKLSDIKLCLGSEISGDYDHGTEEYDEEVNGILQGMSMGDLIESGTSFFDAYFYTRLPGNEKSITSRDEHSVQITMQGTNGVSENAASDLAVLYITLLTQAKPIHSDNDPLFGSTPCFVSSFVQNTMKPNGGANEISRRLASFSLALVPHHWIRHIELNGAGDAFLNRIALGVAGYRIPQAFISVDYKDEAPEHVRNLWDFLRSDFSGTRYWTFHPITRPVQVVAEFGSINNVLSDLLAEYGKEEDLNDARTNKLLHSLPRKDFRHRKWGGWTPEKFRQFMSDDQRIRF